MKDRILKVLWWFYHLSGIRFVAWKILLLHHEKSKPEIPLTSFPLWVIAIYIAFFQLASTRYENSVDIIKNRINGIYAIMSQDIYIAFSRIDDVQDMECPYKPDIFNPISVFKSFMPLRGVRYEAGVEQLGQLVEDWSKKTKIVKDENGLEKIVGVLYGIDLNGVHLENTSLDRPHFESVNFGNAHFKHAMLNGGAHFEKAFLGSANFESSYLTGANFEHAYLPEVNFEKAWLSEANLSNANFYEANLKNANLFGAHLEYAYFYKANLQNADLMEANLENVCLCGADLKNVKNLKPEQLSKAFSLYGVKNLDLTLEKKIKSDFPNLLKPNYEVQECNDKNQGDSFERLYLY